MGLALLNPQTAAWTTSAGGGPFSATVAAYVPAATPSTRMLIACVSGRSDFGAWSLPGQVAKGAVLFTVLPGSTIVAGVPEVGSAIYYLINPSAAAENVVASGGGWANVGGNNRDGVLIVYTVVECNTVAPFGAPATNTGIAALATVTAASQIGDAVIDSLAHKWGPVGLVIGAGQVFLGQNNGNWHVGASSFESGAPAVVMSWTAGGVAEWVSSAVSIRPLTAEVTGSYKYEVNIWQEDLEVKDLQGDVIPPWELESNAFMRLLGFIGPNAEQALDFGDRPDMVYIEGRRWSDSQDKATLQSDRSQFGDVILAKISQGDTG